VKLLKEILPRFGIDNRRLRLTWIGASDGIQFAGIMGDLVAQTRELGPALPDLQMVI
jgi:coenzyme F420-reducing hydrogenase delta subunit